MMYRCNRRGALRLAACATGAILAACAPTRETRPALHLLSRPELINVLGDTRLVHALGLAYRARFPKEADAVALHAAMAADCTRPLLKRPGRLRLVLENRIRDDFRQGRTVEINGWILALTEARQCALYSLLPA